MENLTLFGIALGALAVAAVKCAQDLIGFGDKEANLVRAVLGAALYLLIQNADAIQAAWPYFELAITQGGGALAIFLSVLGYWNDLQRIGYKATGRTLPQRLQ